VVERGDDDAERRELEKFLRAIERTPWNTGRGPGIRRSDATPLGCAGRVMTLGAFVALLLKSLVGFAILAPLGFALSLSAAISWQKKRLAHAEQSFRNAPAARPGRDAVRSDTEGNLP
jgi:hypothetical protein